LSVSHPFRKESEKDEAPATFSLEDANKALEAVKHETEDGPAVIVL
jgi:hypothetical protein